MTSIHDVIARLAREDEGASAAEYAVLVALIAAAVAVAVAAFNLGGFGGIYAVVRQKVLDCVSGNC